MFHYINVSIFYSHFLIIIRSNINIIDVFALALFRLYTYIICTIIELYCLFHSSNLTISIIISIYPYRNHHFYYYSTNIYIINIVCFLLIYISIPYKISTYNIFFIFVPYIFIFVFSFYKLTLILHIIKPPNDNVFSWNPTVTLRRQLYIAI